MPPVSITSKRRPSCSADPCMRSRVIPGSSPTIARRCPVMRLKRVDFPTLGLPTTTTVGMALDMKFYDSRRRMIACLQQFLYSEIRGRAMQVDLTDDQKAFIREGIQSGRFSREEDA